MNCDTCSKDMLARPSIFATSPPVAAPRRMARVAAAIRYTLAAATRLHRYRELHARSLENALVATRGEGLGDE